MFACRRLTQCLVYAKAEAIRENDVCLHII